MMPRLVQLSGVIVDVIYRVEEVPPPGGEAIVHGMTVAAGGGFNAMAAARRCGIDVAFAGTLGTGPFADIAEAALASESIERLRPRLQGHDQGCCTVLVDRHGERSFIAASGADGLVSDDDLASLTLRPDDHLLLSGYALHYPGSREALTHWLENDGKGRRLVFDPCPIVSHLDSRARRAALDAALWVTANRAEGESLTGQSNPGAVAQALAKGRPADGGAILRDGANGCFLAPAGREAAHVPGFAVEPIDTNGAGDAHTGAFIAMLARGEPPLRAAAIANVCAALSTTREGPSTAPDLATVLAAMGETATPPTG
ncbi:PfkB family carbohydrate kinase [Consotaella salsifontis]|uniref:Sugar or nucleoside kinase, ribokinase family n=1 Tax=Consotaella salsifontis TaxID=1365950 RepID=A0A1T4PL15_9HYPH|nr:PfkB family carbohydrate kinase [Consotaella salsifontis]SJZ91936.1 Sugar or nucleoside kinase, ribokinase family [Consotaella salsifontis]